MREAQREETSLHFLIQHSEECESNLVISFSGTLQSGQGVSREMSLPGSFRGGVEVRDTSRLWSESLSTVSQLSEERVQLDEETIAGYGERLERVSQERSLASDLSLHKIHSGLNTMGRLINIVTSVLSLLGADNIDR